MTYPAIKHIGGKKMLDKEKSTEQLVNEIKQTNEIKNFLEKNDEEFVNEPLCEILKRMMKEKNLKKSDVVKRSGLNRVYCYHILSGNRTPSRDKLLAICFGFQFDLDTTNSLLKIVGFPELYARNKRDAVIIFAITSKKNIFCVNEMLFDNGFDILTA